VSLRSSSNFKILNVVTFNFVVFINSWCPLAGGSVVCKIPSAYEDDYMRKNSSVKKKVFIGLAIIGYIIILVILMMISPISIPIDDLIENSLFILIGVTLIIFARPIGLFFYRMNLQMNRKITEKLSKLIDSQIEERFLNTISLVSLGPTFGIWFYRILGDLTPDLVSLPVRVQSLLQHTPLVSFHSMSCVV
jgi:hypothetical protein